MSWLKSVKTLLQGSPEPSRERDAAPPAQPSARTRGKAPAPGPAPRGAPQGRSSQQALSGYGSNPYDTYTWELHTDPDGDRSLKRTTDFNKKPEGGDPTNPYDTGTFRGGW